MMSRLRKLTARFIANRRGVAAIEFAYIAPLMLLAMIGTLEAARAVAIHKRFQRATDMVADLVAREKAIGTNTTEATAALDGMMKSIAHVMKPYSATVLKLGIVAVRAKSNDASNTRVEWSYAHSGYTVPAKCATYAMPATGMLSNGGAAIVVESSYTYSPMLANIIPGFKTNMTWTDKVSYSPRNSCVDYAGTNCVLTCSGW